MKISDVETIKRTPQNKNSSVTVSMFLRQPYTFHRPHNTVHSTILNFTCIRLLIFSQGIVMNWKSIINRCFHIILPVNAFP